MKSAFGILMICFVFVACGEEIEPLKPLQKGMPNTKTLSTGELVYDINGEWDAILDSGASGKMEDIINITQEGNKFVGIILNRNVYWSKGDELIKGELVKNGFKSIKRNIIGNGWIFETIGKIDEGCNKIEVKTDRHGYGYNLIMTLNRK
jgi:hypothetical protein